MLLVKISRNRFALRRIHQCRTIVKIDTQQLRGKLLKSLNELYDLACGLAKNRNIDLSLRNKWVRVAAYCAQTIESLAKGFDERQIDEDLDELERLVNEAKSKVKATADQKGDAAAGSAEPSK